MSQFRRDEFGCGKKLVQILQKWGKNWYIFLRGVWKRSMGKAVMRENEETFGTNP